MLETDDYDDFLFAMRREGFSNLGFIDDKDVDWLQIIAYLLWKISKR